jgi:hypothetical protein
MADVLAPLIVEFLRSLASGPRPYADVMDAWRTSCPRVTVWEDALDAGYVERVQTEDGRPCVALTARGRARLTDYDTTGYRDAQP